MPLAVVKDDLSASGCGQRDARGLGAIDDVEFFRAHEAEDRRVDTPAGHRGDREQPAEKREASVAAFQSTHSLFEGLLHSVKIPPPTTQAPEQAYRKCEPGRPRARDAAASLADGRGVGILQDKLSDGTGCGDDDYDGDHGVDAAA